MRCLGLSALLFAFFLAACSDDDGTHTNQNNNPDATVNDDATTQHDGTVEVDADVEPDATEEQDASVEPGQATMLTVHLHDANQWSLFLDTMTLTAGTETGHHLLVTKDDGPYITLGDGVTGVDMGNTQDYHDIVEAPETGYVGDDPDPLIGWGWKAGGSGPTGFDMTENVYVIKLADDTYAKVEVMSAQAGDVEILCYRQGDGTRNIATAP
jgi:hypothetical protein